MTPGGRSAVLENRFNAPPDYAAKWLTDFRPDDGARFFGFREVANVQKGPSTFHVETNFPWGQNINDIRIDAPDHWSANGRMVNRKGKTIAITHIDEQVRPEGGGTLHRVELTMEPQGFGARFMFALMGGSMMKGLRRGFAKMKVEMEQQYSSGVPPQ